MPENPTLPENAASDSDVPVRPRTYQVRTLGCQMNAHDSERMAGLLEQAGYVRADGDGFGVGADVVVLNTCAVRENAANRLYGTLGLLAQAQRQRPGMQIAVGGCLAQKDRHAIVEAAPWVDVVFGTHNIDALPVLLARAAHNAQAQVEIAESLQVFPSTLPTRREQVYAAWVSISVGCNNSCTFCIVPALRGKERDRAPAEVLAEVEALVADGVVEVTLLGQNVNTYGTGLGERGAFAALLRSVGRVDGIERVRFTSPHPSGFDDDVVEAMAGTPTVMPSLHMPLQSGSDRVLRAMRRSYRAERFLGILDRVRQAIPGAAITTDVIVGFPGETEADFAATLEVVEAARFASAFTFQYSPRPGTPAARMADQVPPEVVAERYARLVEVTEREALAQNQALVGRTVEVLIGQAQGRKDTETDRMSGRAADNRLVHLRLPDRADAHQADAHQADAGRPRPGDLVRAQITHAAPHHLVADSGASGGLFEVRRTRAGDAWAGLLSPAAPVHPSTGRASVSLGLPLVRA